MPLRETVGNMAVFKYKLQNVLDIKYRMEDQARAVFGAAQAKLNEEEAIRDHLIERRIAYETRGRKLRDEILNPDEMRDNDRAVENIRGQIKEQEKNVEAARKEVDKARELLTDAMQERKIHEKLKENSFEEFKQEINAAESKEVDELVSYTYGERIKTENNRVKDNSNDG